MREQLPLDLLETALLWLEQGHGVAVATVTRARGSSPRPVGSHLVVRQDGLFLGSVSGGCVEAAVILAAQQVIASGEAQTLQFGAAREDALGVGLACGGQIEVLVNVANETPLRELRSAWAQNTPCCALVSARTGRWAAAGAGSSELSAIRDAIDTGRAQWVDAEPEAIFVRPYLRPPRVVIVGAVHIAQALARMARVAGMLPIVVDPRQAFASAERFPEVDIVARWPEEALDSVELDERTAVVALTHDPKIDDPALIRALSSRAFYVGALGSRRTHATRLARLRERGLTELQLSRIHGPVGLPIGAQSPAEIAVSILAELTERLRRGVRYRCSAIILAAGESTRTGDANKLLHPIDGVPMLARVVDTVLSSHVDDVVVVTGHDSQAARDCLGSRRLRFVHNPGYAQGMSTSIRAGIDAAGDADGACIVLGDMPWVSRGHINALLAAFDPTHGRLICVPEFGGESGNPVLWARQYFPALRELRGDRGGKALWMSRPEHVARVSVDSSGIHRDVDTLSPT